MPAAAAVIFRDVTLYFRQRYAATCRAPLPCCCHYIITLMPCCCHDNEHYAAAMALIFSFIFASMFRHAMPLIAAAAAATVDCYCCCCYFRRHAMILLTFSLAADAALAIIAICRRLLIFACH